MAEQVVPDFSSYRKDQPATIHRQDIFVNIPEGEGEAESTPLDTQTKKDHIRRVNRMVSL